MRTTRQQDYVGRAVAHFVESQRLRTVLCDDGLVTNDFDTS
jgi:hypothetical protein